ncbi:acyltransferase [Amedibacillus dolichus]|uniref:Bacterial transferase hexapeptide repeat protein n=1 Tax=Amedibacillus dolichus DSM 3991 TaxID=428127 RepID=A8REA2_9FIRM|nr:acyltransferase [Amedibacillus dolichus]EDP10490.1 bacterial transferase hexapeptide repeat protein [Amedibacillus dolichus DSM 3991]
MSKKLKVRKRYLLKATIEFMERIRFYLIPTAQGRIKWLKKHNKFAYIGEHVHYQPRKYPTDSKNIKIHNNVAIASNVEFTAHDIIHFVFDGQEGKRTYKEYEGCIEILDNVFIGAGTRILPNVKIGPNSIIAAESLVVKDVPEGTIVGGNPAKVIGNFDDLKKKRKMYSDSHQNFNNSKLWDEFYRKE